MCALYAWSFGKSGPYREGQDIWYSLPLFFFYDRVAKQVSTSSLSLLLQPGQQHLIIPAMSLKSTIRTPVQQARGTTGASTSSKKWTDVYSRRHWRWVVEENRTMFGGGLYDDPDKVRLEPSCNIPQTSDPVYTEDEVKVQFATYFHAVRVAYARLPNLFFRYGIAPSGQTMSSKTVDVKITRRNPEADTLVVGEFKKPGVINPNMWLKKEAYDNNFARLAQELVG